MELRMQLKSNEQALHTIFKGTMSGSVYWRVVGTLGNWDYYYCDEFGQQVNSTEPLRRWGVTLSQASDYAWKLADDANIDMPQYSPVICKIKELENRYANRNNCR